MKQRKNSVDMLLQGQPVNSATAIYCPELSTFVHPDDYKKYIGQQSSKIKSNNHSLEEPSRPINPQQRSQYQSAARVRQAPVTMSQVNLNDLSIEQPVLSKSKQSQVREQQKLKVQPKQNQVNDEKTQQNIAQTKQKQQLLLEIPQNPRQKEYKPPYFQCIKTPQQKPMPPFREDSASLSDSQQTHLTVQNLRVQRNQLDSPQIRKIQEMEIAFLHPSPTIETELSPVKPDFRVQADSISRNLAEEKRILTQQLDMQGRIYLEQLADRDQMLFDLQQKVDQLNQVISIQELKMNLMVEQIEQKEKENTSLLETNTKQINIIAFKDKQEAVKFSDWNIAKVQNTALTDELKQKNSQLIIVTAENETYQTKIAELEAKITDLTESNNYLKINAQKCDVLARQVTEFNKQIAWAEESKQKELQQVRAYYEYKLTQPDERTIAIIDENQELKRLVSTLKTQSMQQEIILDRIQQSLRNEKQTHEGSVQEFTEKLMSLSDQLTEIRKQSEQLKTNKVELEGQVQQLESQLQEASSLIDKLRNELEEYQKQSDEKEAAIQTLTDQVQYLQDKNNQQLTVLEDEQFDNSKLRQELKQRDDQLNLCRGIREEIAIYRLKEFKWIADSKQLAELLANKQ